MSAILALEALEQAKGSNAKTAILVEEVNNALLKQVFVASFDPFANYGVAKFKMPVALDAADVSDDELLALFLEDLLPRMESRDLSGNAAKSELEKFLSGCTEAVQKWCKRILLKNLRCGVQATTVCKVWEGLIQSFNVQLASSIDAVGDALGNLSVPGVVYPVMVDPKLDGLRCLVIKQGGEVTMYTRNGNEIDTLSTILAAIKAPFPQ
jgi:DNA ligase-1